MNNPAEAAFQCPFCGTATPGPYCPSCGRDRTAPRQVCRSCGEMTPKGESECSHCGTRQVSELTRKVPLIVAIFAVAIGLSLAIRLFLD